MDLVRLELSAISSIAVDKCGPKYAVVGSGPLPLTSICLANALNDNHHQPICIHNIDRDPWAILKSAELCRRLGYGPATMCFHCGDVQSNGIDFQEFDIVYLAALVGMSTQAKRDIVANISSRMRPGALLLLRSVHSLRSLMYPVRLFLCSMEGSGTCSNLLPKVVDLKEDLGLIGLETLLVVHPYHHVMNSIIITRIRSPSD